MGHTTQLNRLFLRTVVGHTTNLNIFFLTQQPILLRQLSLTFYWAAHQPQCVETYTCHLTCIQIQTGNSRAIQAHGRVPEITRRFCARPTMEFFTQSFAFQS